MIHNVIFAQYKGEYLIELAFDNGRRGIVDFSKYRKRGGVFERFNDIEFFRKFRINEDIGVLTWDDFIDIAPETLYSEATGEPLPDWMLANGVSAD